MKPQRKSHRFTPVFSTPVLMLAPLTLVLLAGCSEDMAEFHELDRLRIVGMSADPPWLSEETGPKATTLRAAVFSPNPDPIEYRWSWCPLSLGSQGDFQCAITAEQLRSMVPTLPADFSFELSQTSSATFAYPFKAALSRQICDALEQGDRRLSVNLPLCQLGFDVEVQLEVRQNQRSRRGQKKIRLMFNQADLKGEPPRPPNRNPVIKGVRWAPATEPKALRVWGEADEPVFKRNKQYLIVLEVDPKDAEPRTRYEVTAPETPVESRESLTVTWLAGGGGFKRQPRTGWMPQSNDAAFQILVENEFEAPTTKEYPLSTIPFIWVIRDDQMGQSWLKRKAKLQ